jgi:hypothetical protein
LGPSTYSGKRRKRRQEGGKAPRPKNKKQKMMEAEKRKKQREILREAIQKDETKEYYRDTSHLDAPGELDSMMKFIDCLKLTTPPIDLSQDSENVCEISKIINLRWEEVVVGEPRGRLIATVQWVTTQRDVERDVTEEDVVGLVHIDGLFEYFYQYIIRGPSVRRHTGRSQGTGRNNGGARDVSAEDLLQTIVVPHAAHMRSSGKSTCMRDSIMMVFSAHGMPLEIDTETDYALHDQQFAINYIRSKNVDVMVTTNHYDPEQQTNAYHRMPEVPGVFLCIAMSPNNIKHGFVVDTRGEVPVLLDSALPTAVQYTEDAMRWVKSWQKVYRTTIKITSKKS